MFKQDKTMYSNLQFSDWKDHNLINKSSSYSIAELQLVLISQIQTNIVYLYCESLIQDDLDCEEKIIQLFDNYRNQISGLPSEILAQFQQSKSNVKIANERRSRSDLIDYISNLILENTLLHNSIIKFIQS